MIQCKSNQQNMDRGKMLQGKCPGFSTDNYKERKEKRETRTERNAQRDRKSQRKQTQSID